MPGTDDEQRRIEELNWLGKAVYITGRGVSMTTDLIDSIIDIAADAYVEAERAFKQGLDPLIDDANILEEQSHDDIETRKSTTDSP